MKKIKWVPVICIVSSLGAILLVMYCPLKFNLIGICLGIIVGLQLEVMTND